MPNQSPLNQLLTQAQQLLTDFDLAAQEKIVAETEQLTLQADFWSQPGAEDTIQQLSARQHELKQYQTLAKLIGELITFQELQTQLPEEETRQLAADFQPQLTQLTDLTNQLKLKQFLNGPYDAQAAILSVHPGQGGTEAMDFAQMLARMYLKFLTKQKWKFSILNEIPGEEAGIKEISLEVTAPYAYGYLKGERGTHRLVRLSPFNANNLRQTSFALVEVLPVIPASLGPVIKDEDLIWHFTRSGGPGGQSVNKTSSAVELTYRPTGLVVACRQERSQTQNKEQALKILRAQLARLEEEKIARQISLEKGHFQEASWGTQIRNYVLQPYQLVKDVRTQVQTNNPTAVLDGDLTQFIEAEIRLNKSAT